MAREKIQPRGDRRIMQRYHTFWTKAEIRVLAYFKKYISPSTYRDICRAYVKSNYATFKKACEDLKGRGYLIVDSDGKYFPTRQGKILIEKESFSICLPLPYFDTFRKELK